MSAVFAEGGNKAGRTLRRRSRAGDRVRYAGVGDLRRDFDAAAIEEKAHPSGVPFSGPGPFTAGRASLQPTAAVGKMNGYFFGGSGVDITVWKTLWRM